MKIYQCFSVFIATSILLSAISTYAFKQSAFRITFHNNTNGNIVTIKKRTNPEGGSLRDNIGPTDMKPGEMHKFFLIQNPQKDSDKHRSINSPLEIKMSWQLTVKNKAGKILCQNNVLGWVKGNISFIDDTGKTIIDTHNWRYKFLSMQSSDAYDMCNFSGAHPKKMPKSFKKYGLKCYPLSISVDKDNSLHILTVG